MYFCVAATCQLPAPHNAWHRLLHVLTRSHYFISSYVLNHSLHRSSSFRFLFLLILLHILHDQIYRWEHIIANVFLLFSTSCHCVHFPHTHSLLSITIYRAQYCLPSGTVSAYNTGIYLHYFSFLNRLNQMGISFPTAEFF